MQTDYTPSELAAILKAAGIKITDIGIRWQIRAGKYKGAKKCRCKQTWLIPVTNLPRAWRDVIERLPRPAHRNA